MKTQAWAVALNPEPWAMGKIGVFPVNGGKKWVPKVSPDKTMKNYQEAIAEELRLQGAEELPGPFYMLRFTFSRQLVKYTVGSTGRTSTRNWADVTNMQKATEDAMQGVLLPNDRAVIACGGRLADIQAEETLPWVVIEICYDIPALDNMVGYMNPFSHHGFSKRGRAAYDAMMAREEASKTVQNNEWSPE